jgi:hypothetical protein
MVALLIELFATIVAGAGAVVMMISFLLFYLIFSVTKTDK